jgi:hypothetical protein
MYLSLLLTEFAAGNIRDALWNADCRSHSGCP